MDSFLLMISVVYFDYTKSHIENLLKQQKVYTLTEIKNVSCESFLPSPLSLSKHTTISEYTKNIASKYYTLLSPTLKCHNHWLVFHFLTITFEKKKIKYIKKAKKGKKCWNEKKINMKLMCGWLKVKSI